MAGRKFGVVLMARTPSSYLALSATERAKPGKAFDQVLKKYAGRVDLLRRYWTSAFTADVSDVFVMECDDLADMHRFQEELDQLMARGGDPQRFGRTVSVTTGLNPDAEAPASRGRRSRK